MKIKRNCLGYRLGSRLGARLCSRRIFGLALLAASLTVGGSLVRAEEPEAASSALHNIVFEPIAKAVQGLEQRIGGLETSVMAFAASFTSAHITTQQLCVFDDSGGAPTCITKAQLDALLKRLPE